MLSNFRVRKNNLDTPIQSVKSLLFSIFVHLSVVFLLFYNPIVAKRIVNPDSVYSVSIVTETPKPNKVNKQEPENKTENLNVMPKEPENRNELEKKAIEKIPEKKISKEMPDQKQVLEKNPLTPESLETPESIYEELSDSTPRSEHVKTAEKPLNDLSQTTGNKIEVRIDNSEFPYAWYTGGLKNKINFHWEPVDITILRGNMVTVIVAFRIKEDGKVENVFVEKSSGIPMYDNSTVRAIYNSVPFPPFPEGYKGNYLDIHFEFEYHKVKNQG